MRGLLGSITAAALLGAGVSSFGDHGHGRILLPLATTETPADRRKRNEAAGGRKKRIAKQKARKSYGRRRLYQRSPGRYRYGTPRTDGRIFLSDKRHEAFLESMKVLEPIVGNYEARRAQAIKNARRVAA